MARIVLETFENCHGIDPRIPSAVLTHLMSMCQLEDPASVYHRFHSLRISLPLRLMKLSRPTLRSFSTTTLSNTLFITGYSPYVLILTREKSLRPSKAQRLSQRISTIFNLNLLDEGRNRRKQSSGKFPRLLPVILKSKPTISLLANWSNELRLPLLSYMVNTKGHSQ
ncbi:hypothetical protein P9112_010169 [Eukaryota sp. TZLM1-RC]